MFATVTLPKTKANQVFHLLDISETITWAYIFEFFANKINEVSDKILSM